VKHKNEEFSKSVETSAYTSALHYDENTWDILNQSIATSGSGSGSGFRVSNKRELLV
jgi:hypothetical protein